MITLPLQYYVIAADFNKLRQERDNLKLKCNKKKNDNSRIVILQIDAAKQSH